MENFIVSARKYRPSTFNSVVGQAALTVTLKNAIQRKQLAQAYLFCGPRGVGKTTCARIFAKTINCLNQTPQIEACNQCESCVSFNSSRSFNIHELDAASNNSVEGIRKLIEQVRIPPQIGKYSVYIIDEVHMLSQAAFNAFLKTLEEPPAHAIFILATTEKHKILPTILSRCQIFDFNRIKVEDTVKYLEHIAKTEKVEYEVEALNIIAQKADGAMRDALSIFDQVVSFSDNHITYAKVIENLNVLDYHYYFRLTENFLQGNFADSLRIFDELLSKGFDAQQFVAGLSLHLRNLLVCKDPQTVVLLEVGTAIAERYKQMALSCPADLLIRALDLANQCDVSFRQSTNQRLHVELMLIRLSSLTQEKKKDSDLSLTTSEAESTPVPPEISTPSPAKPKPEVSPKPNIPKTPPKSFSLKGAMSSPPIGKANDQIGMANDQPKEVNDSGNGGSNPYVPVGVESTPFDQGLLTQAWSNFANSIMESNPRHYSLLQSYPPTLGSSHQVIVVFEGQIQVELFQEIKNELTAYLRKQLQNSAISIAEAIQEQQTQNRPYTPDEKFRFMAEKNPTLIKLKQQMNLDFS